MSFLVLERLEKTFPDGTRAVRGLDLAVNRGELVVLLGPSGCGKTTTLRMVAGLEKPTGGRVLLEGWDETALAPSLRDVGFVFQFHALYPHLSVFENVAFPLRAAGVKRREIRQRVNRILAEMDLAEAASLAPSALGARGRQMVGLARALVRRPRFLLMDEPLGTLEAGIRREMRQLIRAKQLADNITTLYVTHDQEEALALGDRIAVMRDGLVEQVGSPTEIYDDPRSLFVADFVGSPGMNLIRGRIARSEGMLRFAAGALRIDVAGDRPEGEVVLGIRCEHVRPDPRGPIAGRVLVNEYQGMFRFLHAEVGGQVLVARCPPADHTPAGTRVRLSIDPDRICWLDPEGSAEVSAATVRSPSLTGLAGQAARGSGAALSLEGVSKRFRGTAALKSVTMDVHEGELVVVLGPARSGKSTLLRVIAGLETPEEGRTRFGGHDITAWSPAQRDVAMIFQGFSLYPRKTVRQNLAFPLQAPGRKMPAEKISALVERAADLLGLTDKLDKPARQLSGGEMQRVAIGRAIVRQPRLFLLDEPLTNLDAKLREALRVELVQIQRALGVPMILVSHDQADALGMGDRVVVLIDGQVAQVGTPQEVYERPESAQVARMLGVPPINLLSAERTAEGWRTADGAVVLGPIGPRVDRSLLGVRPENVRIARHPTPAPAGGTPGVVRVVEHMGSRVTLLIRWAGQDVHAVAHPPGPEEPPWTPGERVHPWLRAETVLFYGPEGGRLLGDSA